MTYKKFLTQIKRKNISPFYLFEGEEKYLKREALQKLKAELISGNEDFNYQLLTPTSYTGREILELACQLPFNNRWQLLVVEEADRLTLKDEKIIMDYLKNPVNSTCLVLVGERFNPQSRLYKFFKEKDKLVIFYPLREMEAIEWIKNEVKEKGKTITDEAALELYRRCGGNLFLLRGEIDKLICFVHPQGCIEELHVIQLAGENPQESIFDFLYAFRQKDLSLAIHLLNRLFMQGEEPLAINAMLTREVRILLWLKLEGERITPSRASKYIFKGKTSYSDFFLKKAKEYIKASKKFTLAQLLFAQERLLDTEFYIKKGREKPDIAIQRAVIDILSHQTPNPQYPTTNNHLTRKSDLFKL